MKKTYRPQILSVAIGTALLLAGHAVAADTDQQKPEKPNPSQPDSKYKVKKIEMGEAKAATSAGKSAASFNDDDHMQPPEHPNPPPPPPNKKKVEVAVQDDTNHEQPPEKPNPPKK